MIAVRNKEITFRPFVFEQRSFVFSLLWRNITFVVQTVVWFTSLYTCKRSDNWLDSCSVINSQLQAIVTSASPSSFMIAKLFFSGRLFCNYFRIYFFKLAGWLAVWFVCYYRVKTHTHTQLIDKAMIILLRCIFSIVAETLAFFLRYFSWRVSLEACWHAKGIL